jgi:integrase
MPRPTKQLTDVAIRNKRVPGYCLDGEGLYLQVSKALTKSWIFRYTRNGKTREMGLGSTNAVSLSKAREKARACRELLAERKDPIEARDKQSAIEAMAKSRAITFQKAAETYIADHRSSWKNQKHAQQWAKTLETYAHPIIGDLQVNDIDTPHVQQILQPIWETKRETATRLRGRIEKVLDWAKVAGYREKGTENPARWKGHIELLLPAKGQIRKQQPALPFHQIGAFCNELKKRPSTSADALEFLILTTMRTFPVMTAERGEFDISGAVWTIPAVKMKGQGETGRDHRVPLSPRAVEIIRARLAKMEKTDRWIFPGQKAGESISNAAMSQLVRGMNEPEKKWIDPRQGGREVVPHGFRSTFKDWASEETNYPNEISEMALAHRIGSKTEEAYRRGDLLQKRRAMMEDWARYCATAKIDAKIVSIKRKKASTATR